MTWLAIFLSLATIYDVETTFHGINHGAREGNPIMRPVIEAGKPTTYLVMGGVNAAVLYYAHHLKEKGHKGWYIAPAVAISTHGVAGTLNLRF